MMTTTGIKCGKCKGYHPTIADIRACSGASAAVAAPPLPGFVANPATVRQVNFIRSLADRKDWAAPYGRLPSQVESDASETIMNVLDGKQISFDEARSCLDWMTKLPDEARTVATTVDIKAGMYKADDGTIYRAYLGQQQSGQILAKRIVLRGDPLNRQYGMEYAGLAARFVRPDQRMSLEDAKKWGKATGTCCVCARRLDVPESVDAGIGPVCAGKDWE